MVTHITVDNNQYDLICGVSRTAEVQSSDISGLLLDRSYFHDVIGVYMRYEVGIAVPVGKEDQYATLYEVLTDTAGEHSFVLPYNQTTIEVRGRVENVTDQHFRTQNGKEIWRGIRFTVTSNYPKE